MSHENPGEQSKGVLVGLTDLRFQYMITPRLIGWMYAGTVIVIGGWCLWCLLLVWWLAYWAGWGWWVLAPVVIIGGLVATLAARVALEWVIMAFTRGRTIPTTQAPPVPPPTATPEPPTRVASRRAASQDGERYWPGD